jgi:hypothetical protein
MTEEFDFAAESAALKEQFDTGDGRALLDVIQLAFAHHQRVPEWAGAALMGIIQRAEDGAFASWDQPFGPPQRMGTPKGAIRRSRERLAHAAAEDEFAKQAKEQGKRPALDNEFFEAAARRSGLGGRSTVMQLYSAFAKKLRRLISTD